MAAPITALNCVVYLRAMVSVLCLGRLGPLDLAGGALAIGLTNITGHSVLFGLASGLEPLCAQAFGSRNYELLTLSVQRAVLLLFLAAVPIALLWLNVGPILVALGQDPTISAHAASYAAFALPDLAAGAVLQPLRVYLRSQGITRPMAACSAIAVALHVPLNVGLVFGMGLGVRGVAAAQALTNTNMLLFLLAYIRWARACEGTWKGFARPAAVASGLPALASLAVPSCVGVCLEWWWYEVVTVLAGYLPNPAAAVGAAGVVIQTTSLMYTVPMALAACVSTRVSTLSSIDISPSNMDRRKRKTDRIRIDAEIFAPDFLAHLDWVLDRVHRFAFARFTSRSHAGPAFCSSVRGEAVIFQLSPCMHATEL